MTLPITCVCKIPLRERSFFPGNSWKNERKEEKLLLPGLSFDDDDGILLQIYAFFPSALLFHLKNVLKRKCSEKNEKPPAFDSPHISLFILSILRSLEGEEIKDGRDRQEKLDGKKTFIATFLVAFLCHPLPSFAMIIITDCRLFKCHCFLLFFMVLPFCLSLAG